MKKWFVLIMAVFCLVVPFSSASAQSVDELDSKPYHIKGKKGSTHYYFVFSSKPKMYTTFYNNQYFFYPDSSLTVSYYTSSDGVNYSFSSKQDIRAESNTLGLESVEKTTFDIYKDDSYKSVFFSEPRHPVTVVPRVMMESLVGGGILSTGLVILAIMLGVSLVPRLKFWFLR